MTKKSIKESSKKKAGAKAAVEGKEAGKAGRKKAESATSTRKSAAEKKIAKKTDSKKAAEKSPSRKETARAAAKRTAGKKAPAAPEKKSTAKKQSGTKAAARAKTTTKKAPAAAAKKSTAKKSTAKAAAKERTVPKKAAPKAASKKSTTKDPATKTDAQKDKKSRLRRRAEAELVKQMDRLNGISGSDKDELIHELGTYQVELEIQNEELRRAQAELEESRARLADLYNQAPVGYFTFDPSGRITSVNRTGAVMLDATREKLVNKLFGRFVHPKDSDKFHLHLRAMMEERTGQALELRLLAGIRGLKRHVKLESIPVQNEAGEVLEIRSTVSDITQRIKDQEKLMRQNALLRAIINHTDVQMAYLDPDFNFIWVNQPYAENCGMDPQEISGVNHFEFFPHAENEEIFRRVRDTREMVFYKDKPFRYPKQPERGVTYWDWTLTPVQDESGRLIGLVLSLRETTEFKKAQLALEESEAQFRIMAETSIDIIFQIDYSGTVLYVSPAVRSLGYSLEEVIGRPFNDFLASEDVSRAEKTFGRILNGKSVKLEEFRLIHAEGFRVDFEINASPMIREGLITGVQGIARDITERLLAEEKIKQLARFPAENPFPVMRVSEDGLILYANSASSLLLTQWQTNTGEPVPDEIIDLIRETRESGEILEVELTCGNRILTLNLVPIYDGSFVNVYGHDITERKMAERRIRDSEARLETTLENLTEAVVVSDLDGNLIYWNSAAISQFGFISEDEYLKAFSDFQDIFELSSLKEGVLPLERWPIYRILQGETIDNLEITVKRRDSEWKRVFSFSGTLARDNNNNPIQAILVLSDVTDRKKAEMKIIQQNAVLTGINLIFQAGMQCETDEELAEETLSVAEQIIGSRFGFIGEIGQDNLLHDTAMTDPGWQQCKMVDKTGHKKPPGNFRIAGLYGQVLAAGKPLLTNDPASHPASIGTPEGHPALSSFLGMPLKYGRQTIGLIALANKPGGFSQDDLEIIKALSPAYNEILYKCRAERAVAESAARERRHTLQLKQIIDFNPIPMWISHDPECRNITGNLAAADLMGVGVDINVSQSAGPEEQPLRVIHIQNGRELDLEELPLQKAVFNATTLTDLELDLVMPGGRVRSMLGAATPLFDEKGQVRGGIAAYVDITERKQIEKQLHEAKQDWENTFDAVPDLIAILDQDHRITRVNRSMAEKLGVAPDELIGQKCYECCHGRTEPVDNCPHMLLLGDKKEHSLELNMKRFGGYFLITTTPLFDEHKNIIRSIHVARDITKQKVAEAKIRKLNRDLQINMLKLKLANEDLIRSNEDLQHFASIVSHDLQEPLRTVSSFVQLIARRYEEMLDEKGQVFIRHVIEGTTHMQRLLNDLLSYSRVGGGELKKRTISLEKVLKDVKRNLDRKIKENRAIITSTALPELSGDEMQLFTLLQNLISNAIKYRRQETPRINISATQNNENEWLFCVQDNGIGFEPKHAEQIFLIFQRLHLRNEYEGTGIGLAVCKKIVERHGGRIWAESAPGRGSSFYFTLPVHVEGDYE